MGVAALPPLSEDGAALQQLLGREPQGAWEVVVRDRRGRPVVIRNSPVLDDGTPMPTLYWLVGEEERKAVARLEAAGGVRRAEAAVPADAVVAAHRRYAAERDAAARALAGTEALPAPARLPSGGVGGTRAGVKCLHAHLAWYLAGGDDPVGRFAALELGLDPSAYVPWRPVAAVDCGTNSTRLLVLGPDGRTRRREMRITRLGEGVDRTGRLAAAAVRRTLDVLESYRDLCVGVGVARLRASATSAVRDASNADEFLDAAGRVLGVRPEVLPGEDEGRLAFAGATRGLGPAVATAHDVLVVDVGGGSTELVAGRGDGRGRVTVASLDVGCVRVTERFLHGDPPRAEELAAARAHVRGLLDATLARLPGLAAPRVMVGLAGTVSALVVLERGLERYDHDAVHGARLSRRAVERLLGELAGVPLAERRARPGLEADRAPVIVGGALVLDEVMGRLGHEELVASETDLLDGLAATLLDPPLAVPPTPGGHGAP